MKKYSFIVLSILFSLLNSSNMSGQESKPSISTIVSKTEVFFGNAVKVDFVIKNAKGKFEPPAFSEFDILSGPNTSTSMMNINGVITTTSKYTYCLQPKKEGKLHIESAYLIIEGDKSENMESPPISIIVKANPTGIIEEEIEEEIGSQFFSFPDIRTNDDFLRQQWGGTAPEKAKPEKSKPKRKVIKF